MQARSDNDLIEAGLELCDTSLKKFVTWWGIYDRSPKHGGNIHIACRIGWHAVVERMLSDGVDVNLRTLDSDECPLHAAVCYDENYAVVKLLLDCGFNVNAEDDERMRPLHRACLANATQVAKLLLDSGVDVDAVSDYGTALCRACTAENEGIVQLLLGRGAKVNLGDSGNGLRNFPLVIACRYGHIMIAQDLINHGADINPTDSFNGTALTAACCRGQESIVRLLLDSGAGASKQSIVQLLIKGAGRCKQASYKMAVGISPLHGAAWEGSVKVAQLLIYHGADVDTQDDSIGTPLILAAHRGLYSMVEFLLTKGADVPATGDLFVNAVVAAAQARHRHILQLLLSHGTRFCKSDWEGLRDLGSEGYLLKLDSIYEQVKGKNMQETIEVLLATEGLISLEVERFSDSIQSCIEPVWGPSSG